MCINKDKILVINVSCFPVGATNRLVTTNLFSFYHLKNNHLSFHFNISDYPSDVRLPYFCVRTLQKYNFGHNYGLTVSTSVKETVQHILLVLVKSLLVNRQFLIQTGYLPFHLFQLHHKCLNLFARFYIHIFPLIRQPPPDTSWRNGIKAFLLFPCSASG